MDWRKILKFTPSAPAFVEFSPFKSLSRPRKEPSFIDNNRFQSPIAHEFKASRCPGNPW